MEFDSNIHIPENKERSLNEWKVGTINNIVGSGDNAKHSIVTITIMCGFVSNHF